MTISDAQIQEAIALAKVQIRADVASGTVLVGVDVVVQFAERLHAGKQ